MDELYSSALNRLRRIIVYAPLVNDKVALIALASIGYIDPDSQVTQWEYFMYPLLAYSEQASRYYLPPVPQYCRSCRKNSHP